MRGGDASRSRRPEARSARRLVARRIALSRTAPPPCSAGPPSIERAMLFLPRVLLTSILPGYKLTVPPLEQPVMNFSSPLPSHIAFDGHRRIASGPLAVVALEVKRALAMGTAGSVLVFDNATGRSLDIDTRRGRRRRHRTLRAPYRRCKARERRPWRGHAKRTARQGASEAWRCRARGDAAAASLGLAREATRRRISGFAKTGRRRTSHPFPTRQSPRRPGARLSLHVRHGRRLARFRGSGARCSRTTVRVWANPTTAWLLERRARACVRARFSDAS